MTSVCPPREYLSDFVQGRLDVPKIEEVSAHIEDCTVCRQTLSELSSTVDSLQDKVRQAATEQSASPAARPRSTAETRSENPPLAWPDLRAALLKLELATVAEVEALAMRFGAEHPSDAVENAICELVQTARLTKFQAQVILQGKAAALVYGDYIVQDKLGAGGMGQVYLAVHRKMRRQVALKSLPSSALKNAEAVKRFRREVEAAGQLVHSNIVIAHDAGERLGTWYLVMQYVAGSDLSKMLKRRGPLPAPEAVGYLAQAARGLAFAHSRGIVHRDIKPANLLVDAEGTVKILDMGLARFSAAPGDAASPDRGELTHSGQLMGTVDYMAPEQAFDTSKADEKADVYSLGCSLYRLLTNQPPYAGNTLVEKILAHRERPIPSLCDARPDVPPALDALFQRLVAKRPEDRPTAAEAATLLDAVLTAPAMPPGATLPSSPSVPNCLAVDEIESGPRGSVARPGTKRPAAEHNAPQPPTSAGRGANKKPPLTRIAAGAAGFLLIMLGVWFVFRDKDGKEVASVALSEGGDVAIRTAPPVSSATPPDPIPPPLPTSTAPSSTLPSSTISTDVSQPLAGLPAITPIPVVPSNESPDANVPSSPEAGPQSSPGLQVTLLPESSATFTRETAPPLAQRYKFEITTTDPLQVFSGKSVMFRGYKMGGSQATDQGKHLAYRYELKFEKPTRIDAIKLSGVAFFGSELRLLDAERKPVATFPLTGGNTFQKFSLAVERCAPGTQFYLEEYDVITEWRLRTGIAIASTPVTDLSSGPLQTFAPEPPRAVAPFDAAQARAHQEAWAKHLGTTVETTNSIGMKLVLVPPGTCIMRSFPDPAKRKPSFPVDTAYRIGAFEVTQAEYRKIMGKNPSLFAHSGDTAPVENVTWNDAVEFCRLLSELPEEMVARRTYRLPTTEEWAYAQQAGSDARYFFGDDETQLGEYAWFAENSEGSTHPAGMKRPNPWRLFDMNGNVEEWTAKNWGATASVGMGGWMSEAKFCMTGIPFTAKHEHKHRSLGFRIVCDISPRPLAGAPER
jgi:serine/threonine protein kinase/formylglycine-generating enzyme required for sulfatase activity